MEIWKDELEPQLDGFVVNEQMICFFINDGRVMSLSVSLFPVLDQVGHGPLRNCQATEDNLGVHWPEFELTVKFSDYLGK